MLTALSARLQNKPSGELMTAGLLQSISTDRAKQVNQRIAARGMPSTLTLVGTEETNGRTTYLYRTFARKRLSLWRIGFDKAGLIDVMNLEEEE